MTHAIFLTGTDVLESPKQVFKAGKLEATLDSGALRWIRWHGIEILRAIMFLVRTPGWGTPAAQISNLEVTENPNNFRITYDALYGSVATGVQVSITLEGTASGHLTAKGVIQATAPFETNRTGFVVLHPLAGVVGTEIDVQHASGASRKLVMPVPISPGQPLMDIRALTHHPYEGLSVTTRFEGDIFEMEDHRNWSDASFKTYSRPIGLPYPYLLDQEVPAVQSVEVSICDDGGSDIAFEAIEVPQVKGQKLPAFGLPFDSLQAVENAMPHSEALAEIAPARVLLRYDFTKETNNSSLSSLARLLEVIGASLEIQAILASGDIDGADKELASLAKLIGYASIHVSEISAFAKIDEQSFQPGEVRPDHPSEEAILAGLRKYFPRARHGSGTPAFFTEFNRKRPDRTLADYFTFTTTPSVHAADDASILETLQSLPHILNSARLLVGDKPLRVGPTGIGARINPYGPTLTNNDFSAREGMAAQDPRQRGLFAAAWHVGYLAQLASWSVERFSFGAATGPFGLISTRQTGSRTIWDEWPDGSLYPLFYVAKWISRAAGGELVAAGLEDGLARLEWKVNGKPHTLLANLSAQARDVSLTDWLRPQGHLLDAGSLEAAALQKDTFSIAKQFPDLVKLDAYAVLHLRDE
ncbi:hypothetical protein [Ochrobactrum sp. AN78]|uniref:hypothetical protein n=1 Tax=Ochrobactrum sp. AN78 TaxID=3039853 RepID=UPI00298A02C7|nr:hypothetical protein [Ochrobactrum sp. AN78]MDH7792384.1 hypothetical protein [Ochrobactrum sp. AN78]